MFNRWELNEVNSNLRGYFKLKIIKNIYQKGFYDLLEAYLGFAFEIKFYWAQKVGHMEENLRTYLQKVQADIRLLIGQQTNFTT